jgi:hypothetical protein
MLAINTLAEGQKAWVIIPCTIAIGLPYKRGDVFVHQVVIDNVSVRGRKLSSKKYEIFVEYTFKQRYPLFSEEVFSTLKETKSYARMADLKIIKIRNLKELEKTYEI